jgi:hypothetical protein
MRKSLLILLVLYWAALGPAGSQSAAETSPTEPVMEESVITASLPGRTIAAVVTHWQEHDAFKRAVLLMPGSPGIMKIESAQSFGMKGNFLIRSRRHWLDRETVVFSVDAPSDEWFRFMGPFRASPRYAEDIKALAQQIEQQYGRMEIAVVGTSEGSVSAYYVAKAWPRSDIKVIFTSSLFVSSRTTQGLSTFDFKNFPATMLWVHHASDPCTFTPYHDAQRHAEKTRSSLITVRSSNMGSGHPCEARSPHGYIGVEKETVLAMKDWIVQGKVTDVVLP